MDESPVQFVFWGCESDDQAGLEFNAVIVGEFDDVSDFEAAGSRGFADHLVVGVEFFFHCHVIVSRWDWVGPVLPAPPVSQPYSRLIVSKLMFTILTFLKIALRNSHTAIMMAVKDVAIATLRTP